MGKSLLTLLLTSWVASVWAQPVSTLVGKWAPKATIEGNIKAVNFDVNGIAMTRQLFPELQGKQIIIGQKESAPDPLDIDLTGRLVFSSLTAAEVTAHATMVATILAGAGYSSPLNLGVAPLAKILSVNVGRLSPEPDDFYRQQAITVMNHSYGTETKPFYGPNAAAYDASAWRVPELLHVFSAGNIGYSTSDSGMYAGLSATANVTGEFKQAKNVVTVGAVNELGELLPSSSRGPAYDGRIKPELVAFGDEGTSGAAALISGVAALLQDQYQQKHYTSAPAALLKTILINSADDVGRPGIDHQTGYGNLNAVRAIQTLAEGHYIAGILSANEVREYKLTVPAAQQLKITLNWADTAAVPSSSQALVNDLDLEVVDATGKAWLPWVLNTYPQVDSLRKQARRGLDKLNTTEQVSLNLVKPATYTIRVKGQRIKSKQQPFYVAYQWDEPGTFVWTAPSTTSPVFSDSVYIVRWKHTLATTTGRLEQSTNAGVTWTLVEDQVDLAKGLYLWRSPKLLTRCQLRMVINDRLFPSDTFVVSPLITPSVLFQCADSTGITWSPLNIDTAGVRYTAYRFKTSLSTWEKLGPVSGNRVVFSNNSPNDLFAIEPFHAMGFVGLRGDLVNGLQQHVFCYYTGITATPTSTQINVQCQLSDVKAVEAVTFQRQTAIGFEDWVSLPVEADTRLLTVTDSNPRLGGNTYRIKLRLHTGAVHYSDPITALFSRQPTVFVYPNPVKKGQSITLRTSEYGQYRCQLFDAAGRIVSEDQFNGSEIQRSTETLGPGVYIYRVLFGNKSWSEGRFVVE
ncbi:S8 family serine peptidase [Spirosoma soli]|uniref:S8 family serine peptidase n=1 Tax=Spirosoma soli TaxID=1770529 RepID=A0ABW5M8L8_9BACT